jgi:hypothetical protein
MRGWLGAEFADSEETRLDIEIQRVEAGKAR